ncbi:hypothetical protein BGZ80_002402, partial [Entomortierella chlamydospora]
MPVEYQEFKFGPKKKKLNVISKSRRGQKFVYLPAVLKVFTIQDTAGFEAVGELVADGVNIDYILDDNDKIIPHCPGCVIELVYEAAHYGATSLAPYATPRTPMSLNGSVNQLSIKNKVPTDLDLTKPMSTTLTRRPTTDIQRLLNTLNPDIEQAVQSGRPLNAEATEDLIRKHLAAPTNVNNTQQYIAHNVGMLVQGVGKLKLQGNVLEQLAHKIIEMQQQALDRLALIKSKTEAILTQNYELLEYTIPRL